MSEDFASAVRADGVFAAVFERDDETAYFYLLDLTRPDSKQIVGALNLTGHLTSSSGVDVRWSRTGEAVGLFADGILLAIYPGLDMPVGRIATAADQGQFA